MSRAEGGEGLDGSELYKRRATGRDMMATHGIQSKSDFEKQAHRLL